MDAHTEILLITGPGGSGKSTTSWEIQKILANADIAHAAIETDELDRVYPTPADDPLTIHLSTANLSAIWSNFKQLGHTRLILSGVMTDLDMNKGWISAAIPGAQFMVVRLMPTDAELMEKIGKREIGSNKQHQEARSLEQVAKMRLEEAGEVMVIATTGKKPETVAMEILQLIKWI